MKKILYATFLINLGIIFYFWWQGSVSLFPGNISDISLAFGRLCGLLAVYFVLLQFVLRGRAVWIEETFGLNNLSTVHRLNGYLSISFITLHILLILTSYSITSKTDSMAQLVSFVTNFQELLQAFLAFLLFIAIIFTSVYIVRKKMKYEVWYYVHLMTYLAILLAWGHQLSFGGDFAANKYFVWYWYALYIFVFGNLFLYRFGRQTLLFFKYRFYVSRIVSEADGATSVYISGNNLARFSIKPGQFFILRFLDKKRWLQAHPFSLSFLPKNNELRVTIKNSGDFTSDILSIKQGTKVLLDGPLGTFTASNATSPEQNKFLFIAGGVGITPIRALIEELAPLKKNIILLYSNKTTDIILKQELDALVNQYKFPLYYIVTEDPNFKGEKGRVDADKIKRLAPDFIKRDIYLCGPPPMMNALVKTFKEMGVSQSSLHYERFDL